MFSLRLTAYLLVAPVLAGSFIVALLTVDLFEASYIAIAAIAGAVIGIPAAWWLANKIDTLTQPKKG